MSKILKCSIMTCCHFNEPTILWHWVQNCIGTLDECKARLEAYRQDHSKHGQKYILVEELNTTTPILDSAKLISQLTLIPNT